MGKIRIKDIAEIANVSIGTVDRVIHKRGEVSPATRERIENCWMEHNYKPDIIASSLALKREVHLAVVMPGIVNDHAFWNLPQSGIAKALEELSNYKISIEPIYFNQFKKVILYGRSKIFPTAGSTGSCLPLFFMTNQVNSSKAAF